MKRAIALAVAAVVILGAGIFAYLFWFAGGSGEPSTELTTPEVVGATTTTDAPGSTVTDDTEPIAAADTFVIEPERSMASFELSEVLRGSQQTVVGTTDQVAGQVVVDVGDLGASRFSPIVINARTLSTDSDRRDRAIRGPVILDSGSDEFELITFTPTSVDGLDGVVATVGDVYEFSVTGDLLVKGASNPVTFDVTVEMVDDVTISGVATTEVLRSEYGIGIPSVPGVADVTDEVGLTLEFVAVAG